MADKNIIVNPIKTQPTVNRAIATPNVSGNMGIERRAAETMDKILYEMDDIKTKNEIIGGEAAYAEVQEKVLEYQSMVRHNKEYYQDGTKLAELQSSIGEIKDKYRKMAQNNGYDMRFVNAYVDRMDQGYKASEQVFYQKFAEYSKKLQTDNYLLVMDKKSKNNLTLAGIGDINGALDNYKENVDNLLRGQKEGFISMSELINAAGNLKNGIFHSYVNSFIDDPDGIEKLNAMANYTDEQINQIFEGFNFEKDGYLSVNTPEDFESFRRSVARAVSAYETKVKATEEATLYEKAKAEKELRDNPVDNALKLFPASARLNENFAEFAIAATNYKNGTNFTSLEEMNDNNVAPVTIQGKNDRSALYMDENISATEFMQERLREVNDMVGGRSVFEQMITLDNQYNDGKSDYIMGYNGTILYAKGDTNLRYLYDRLYTSENKKILAKVGKVDGDFLSAFKMYEDEFQPITNTTHNINTMLPGQMSGNPYKGEEGIYKREGKYTKTSLGGTLFGLRIAGINGDKHAERISRDCEQLIKDTTILMIMSENGGLLSEDIAKELDLETYANQPIEVLNSTQKNKVVGYYLEDPGRISKLFGGENPIKKQVRNQLTLSLKEMTAEVQTTDLGHGRFINIRPDLNGGDVAKGVNSVLQTKKFYTKDGLIAPGKQIKVISKIGSDDLLLFYNNEPLLNEDGSRAYINIGGVINE